MKAGKSERTGRIVSVNISRKKGQIKTPVSQVDLVPGEGIRDDAHRGFAHRQISLLMMEDIEEQRRRVGGRDADVIGAGAFAENLTTRDFDLAGVEIGDELRIGVRILLRVTQIGKECHTKCAVYNLTGDCIMPSRGIFCEVLDGGIVRVGDSIEKC
jgi:MOSC domain-containing protein YiiM